MVAAFATQPAFSADSRWIAYAVGCPGSQEEKLRRDKKPIPRKLGLIDLATGNTATIDGIESFAFDASGAHLAMRRYPLEKPNRDPATAGDEEVPGATLIVRTLATGRDASLGSVSEYAWQDKGGLLALVINAEARTCQIPRSRGGAEAPQGREEGDVERLRTWESNHQPFAGR